MKYITIILFIISASIYSNIKGNIENNRYFANDNTFSVSIPTKLEKFNVYENVYSSRDVQFRDDLGGIASIQLIPIGEDRRSQLEDKTFFSELAKYLLRSAYEKDGRLVATDIIFKTFDNEEFTDHDMGYVFYVHASGILYSETKRECEAFRGIHFSTYKDNIVLIMYQTPINKIMGFEHTKKFVFEEINKMRKSLR